MPRKRNAQGAGTIRKRPDGRWEARYVAGRDPGTGKQIRKSVYGDTQGEVRKKLQQAAVAIDEGTYTEPSKLSLTAWLDIWLEEYTGNIKPLTRKSYSTIVNHHLKPSLGAIKINVLDTHTIQMFYNRLHKGTKGEGGKSAKTIKNIHGVLHKALQQATELSYIKYNPTNACKLPRYDKLEMKPLVDDKLTLFMDEITGHKYELIFTLDIFTGMRLSEIIGLTWDCINFDEGNIYLYRQLQRQGKEFVFAPLKNDKPRTIDPPPDMMKDMQRHKRRQAEMRLMAGSAWANDDNLVFTNELGGHLYDGTVYESFKRVVARIGIPAVRFHDLRHSYAVAAATGWSGYKDSTGYAGPPFGSFYVGYLCPRYRANAQGCRHADAGYI